MGQISNALRAKDIQKTIEYIIPSYLQGTSWIIQGIPDCGVEVVFLELIKALRADIENQKNIHVIEMDFSSYWTQSIPYCLKIILDSFPTTKNDKDTTFKAIDDNAILLSILNKSIEKLASNDHYFVFAFEHFDALTKFSNPDEAQQFLNSFQELCYNTKYRTSNIVQCYRDIEDTCKTTNYSDYYKIFGTNHYRVSALADKPLFDSITENAPGLSESTINNIVHLSGGIPEHAEVLLRFAYEKDSVALSQLALDALNLSFKKLEDILTIGEKTTLNAIKNRQTISLEYFSDKNKLRRKGIIVEKNDSIKIISPLFELYLSEKHGATDNKQAIFIRNIGNLVNSLHREILENLFKGRYFIEWNLLQRPLPGDATVYLITGEDINGIPYRPSIVKIDKTERSKLEAENTEIAKSILGPIVPNIISRYSIKGQEGIAIEYATSANSDYSVMQFADYYYKYSPQQIADLLMKVLGQAMSPFYKTNQMAEKSFKQLYFLPKLLQGEYDQIDSIATKSFYYHQNGLQFPFLNKALPNPGLYLKPSKESPDPNSPYSYFFVTKRSVGLCRVHGDLNPRNFLVDGIGNIHVIDFSEMKEEGARFLDFVRIEAEIKFKLMEFATSSLGSVLAIESLLVDTVFMNDLSRLKQLPLEINSQKMLYAVVALRQTARSFCDSTQTDIHFNEEYKLGLLAQTLRISLFQDYLSDAQREFAVLSSSLLIEHLHNGNNRD